MEADEPDEKQIPEVPVKMARSPDIQPVEATHHEPVVPPKEEHFQKSQPVPVGRFVDHQTPTQAPPKADEIPLSSKDYEVYSLNEPANHPLRQPMHSPEKRPSPPQGAKTDAMNISMSYLRNKAHEGAVYYHQDKTFLKKIFRSSKKKKSETSSKIE
jgi:hypothetical protein